MSEKVLVFIDAGFLSKLSKYVENGNPYKCENIFNINLSPRYDYFRNAGFHILSRGDFNA